VSDIAVFVLKRDIKLQLTHSKLTLSVSKETVLTSCVPCGSAYLACSVFCQAAAPLHEFFAFLVVKVHTWKILPLHTDYQAEAVSLLSLPFQSPSSDRCHFGQYTIIFHFLGDHL